MNEEAKLKVLIYQSVDCGIMHEYLRFCGFDTVRTTDEDIMLLLKGGEYDMCILDHLPHTEDLALVRELRRVNTQVPVVVVSSLHEPKYVIEAFNERVDDYMPRPYSGEELVCRLNALVRRGCVRNIPVGEVYKIGRYEYDARTGILKVNGIGRKLQSKEREILSLLCAYEGKVVPINMITKRAWSADSTSIRRSLRPLISRLRDYLQKDRKVTIETVKNVGYMLLVSEF